MQRFLIQVLLSLVLQPGPSLAANEGMRDIPSFIEENIRDEDIILNKPKYNKEARLYYFSRIDAATYKRSLSEETKPLVSIHKKLMRNEASLVLFLDYARKAGISARKDPFLIQCRKDKTKCPIINTIETTTQKALFKPSTGNYGTYSHKQPLLRAADADGNPIAFFYLEKEAVTMLLVHGRGKRTIVKSGADEVNWKAKAIAATHLELLEHIKQREAKAAPDSQK